MARQLPHVTLCGVPRQGSIEGGHTFVTVFELRQVGELQLHRVPIPACPVLDLGVVERLTVGLEITGETLFPESFQNVSWSNSVCKNVGNEYMEIVDILASITITWNLLEQGTVFLCDKIDQSVGEELMAACQLQELQMVQRLVE